jgi:hypothetical protein
MTQLYYMKSSMMQGMGHKFSFLILFFASSCFHYFAGPLLAWIWGFDEKKYGTA